MGHFEPRFGGSHYNLIATGLEIQEGTALCNEQNPAVYRSVYLANCRHLIKSCHDLSEGGLSVAAAEMAFAGRLGISINLDGEDPVRDLFAETGGCFLVEVDPNDKSSFETVMKDLPFKLIGKVHTDPRLIVDQLENRLIDVHLSTIIQAWKDNGTKGEEL